MSGCDCTGACPYCIHTFCPNKSSWQYYTPGWMPWAQPWQPHNEIKPLTDEEVEQIAASVAKKLKEQQT